MRKFKQRILRELCEILAFPERLDKNVGICMNLSTAIFNIGQDLITKLAPRWEKYSGDSMFPIPSSDTTSPREYYMNTRNLWEGEQLELRKEFLIFLICEITSMNDVALGELLNVR